MTQKLVDSNYFDFAGQYDVGRRRSTAPTRRAGCSIPALSPGADDELPRDPDLHRVRDVVWRRQECRRPGRRHVSTSSTCREGRRSTTSGSTRAATASVPITSWATTLSIRRPAARKSRSPAMPIDCANGSADELSTLASHEIIETATDPNVVMGWIDNSKFDLTEPHAALHRGRGRGHLRVHAATCRPDPVRLDNGIMVATTGRTRTTPACRSRRPTSQVTKTDSPDPVNRGRAAVLHADGHEPRAERRARRLGQGHAAFAGRVRHRRPRGLHRGRRARSPATRKVLNGRPRRRHQGPRQGQRGLEAGHRRDHQLGRDRERQGEDPDTANNKATASDDRRGRRDLR